MSGSSHKSLAMRQGVLGQNISVINPYIQHHRSNRVHEIDHLFAAPTFGSHRVLAAAISALVQFPPVVDSASERNSIQVSCSMFDPKVPLTFCKAQLPCKLFVAWLLSRSVQFMAFGSTLGCGSRLNPIREALSCDPKLFVPM